MYTQMNHKCFLLSFKYVNPLYGVLLGLTLSVMIVGQHKGYARGFDLNKYREKGVKSYNDQNYAKAKDTFLKVVQHNSTYASDYLKLARSSYYAEDFELAHVAYLMFFELNPNQKKGGILEEFKGVKSKTDRERVLRKKRAYRDRIETVLKQNKNAGPGKERGTLQ